MRRILIIVGAVAVFAAPASAVAAPPNKADRQEAREECRAERGTTKESKKAFKEEYGSFAACVKEQAQEAKSERREAQKECREERGDTEASIEAFREKYGTNENKKNAFGKCVSQKEDAEDSA